MTINTTASEPAAPAPTFKPGDKVRVMRSPAPPAAGRRPGEVPLVSALRTTLSGLIAEGTVEEGFRKYENESVVVVHGREYDAMTGQQRGNESSTRIEHFKS